MLLIINSKPERIDEPQITVEELLEQKKVSPKGTAVALNNRLVKQPAWKSTFLKEGDNITIITAAYGG